MLSIHLRALLSAFVVQLAVATAWAAPVPECFSNKTNANLAVNNEQVLGWKSANRNQYADRALVRGNVVREIRSRSTHKHFEVQIGARSDETIEIVYNRSFGDLPELQRGQDIDICGDYITTGVRGGGGSVTGAIIHWTHFNPGDRDGGRHEHGYVQLQGVVYGNEHQEVRR